MKSKTFKKLYTICLSNPRSKQSYSEAWKLDAGNNIIEVIAPPGSGKSTLINTLAKTCNFKHASLEEKKNANLEDWEKVLLSAKLHKLTEANCPSYTGKKITQFHRHLLEDKSCRKANGTFILDETGLFRKFRDVMDYAFYQHYHIIDRILADRTLVHLNVPSERIYHQIMHRKNSRGSVWSGHQKKDKGQIVALAERQNSEIQEYLKSLARKFPSSASIVEITNPKSITRDSIRKIIGNSI
ncbi:ATP-binding protein [Halorhodospira halochloris]|uniref:ATP-binding protein n=1 Tax=Halorhodospira halochloris TaxID=1052 RepID=UPI001EE958A1|nr:ATP-binding protein [Halorhodospira halochloris]MCG5549464.1 ATP-binding protein [Halorhodospira halochloris]